jgi:hypothetical protein
MNRSVPPSPLDLNTSSLTDSRVRHWGIQQWPKQISSLPQDTFASWANKYTYWYLIYLLIFSVCA